MSYITFEDRPSLGRITKRWAVVAKRGQTTLGEIAWYAPWRRYCFFPNDRTIWSPGCLADVQAFCEAQTKAREDAREARKAK